MPRSTKPDQIAYALNRQKRSASLSTAPGTIRRRSVTLLTFPRADPVHGMIIAA